MPKTEVAPLIMWGIASATINTGYGPLPYEDWCRLEAKRIGSHCKFVKEGRLCAVFVVGKCTKPEKPKPFYRQETAQDIINKYYTSRNLSIERMIMNKGIGEGED